MITDTGGNVNSGEVFSITYSAGGLTGTTTCEINNVACTGYVVDSDTTAHANAPTTGLRHNVSYQLSIQ